MVNGGTISNFLETSKSKIILPSLLALKAFVEDADYKTCIGQFDGKKHLCSCVIPVAKAKPGEKYTYIEPSDALTLVCQCDYKKSEELFWKIWNEAKARGLENKMAVSMAGYPDILFAVNPQTNQRLLRLILPTK